MRFSPRRTSRLRHFHCSLCHPHVHRRHHVHLHRHVLRHHHRRRLPPVPCASRLSRRPSCTSDDAIGATGAWRMADRRAPSPSPSSSWKRPSHQANSKGSKSTAPGAKGSSCARASSLPSSRARTRGVACEEGGSDRTGERGKCFDAARIDGGERWCTRDASSRSVEGQDVNVHVDWRLGRDAIGAHPTHETEAMHTSRCDPKRKGKRLPNEAMRSMSSVVPDGRPLVGCQHDPNLIDTFVRRYR